MLLAACATSPASPELPRITATITYDEAPGETSGSPSALHLRVLALRNTPKGESLASHTLAIAADRGSPFRGASLLPPGTLWLDPAACAL